VAVLTSLVIERDEALKARVPTRWQAIQSAPIAGPICDRLAEVLQSWLFERFDSRSQALLGNAGG
jgi:hypothetical protein